MAIVFFVRRHKLGVIASFESKNSETRNQDSKPPVPAQSHSPDLSLYIDLFDAKHL
jgi:hypothetical protein